MDFILLIGVITIRFKCSRISKCSLRIIHISLGFLSNSISMTYQLMSTSSRHILEENSQRSYSRDIFITKDISTDNLLQIVTNLIDIINRNEFHLITFIESFFRKIIKVNRCRIRLNISKSLFCKNIFFCQIIEDLRIDILIQNRSNCSNNGI